MSLTAPVPLYPPGVSQPWVKTLPTWEPGKDWPKGARRLFEFFQDLKNRFNGICYWTTRRLAEQLRCTESTIWKALKWLEDNGLISRWWKYGPIDICGRVIQIIVDLKKAAEKIVNPSSESRRKPARAATKVVVTPEQQAIADARRAEAEAAAVIAPAEEPVVIPPELANCFDPEARRRRKQREAYKLPRNPLDGGPKDSAGKDPVALGDAMTAKFKSVAIAPPKPDPHDLE